MSRVQASLAVLSRPLVSQLSENLRAASVLEYKMIDSLVIGTRVWGKQVQYLWAKGWRCPRECRTKMASSEREVTYLHGPGGDGATQDI